MKFSTFPISGEVYLAGYFVALALSFGLTLHPLAVGAMSKSPLSREERLLTVKAKASYQRRFSADSEKRKCEA